MSVVVEHGGGGSTAAAPIARDIVLAGALMGGMPPLTAYPADQRNRIEAERDKLTASRPRRPERRAVARMSYLEYNVKTVPSGLRKVLHVNWPLVLLLAAVASVGFLMLYSVAGGRIEVWAEPQMKRFAIGIVGMLMIGFVPIWFWRNVSAVAYLGALSSGRGGVLRRYRHGRAALA